MNASGACASRCMRVLSPRIEPPERRLEGSTASTATWWPCSIRWAPSASMKVDLPAPGVPEMPSRTALPVAGSSRLEQRLRLLLVIGPARFDQRDRARERPPVAGQHALGQVSRAGSCEGLGSRLRLAARSINARRPSSGRGRRRPPAARRDGRPAPSPCGSARRSARSRPRAPRTPARRGPGAACARRGWSCASARSARIIARFMMSAAEPWIGALIAARSA